EGQQRRPPPVDCVFLKEAQPLRHAHFLSGVNERDPLLERRGEDECGRVVGSHSLELAPAPTILVVIAGEVHPIGAVRKFASLPREVRVQLHGGSLAFAISFSMWWSSQPYVASNAG